MSAPPVPLDPARWSPLHRQAYRIAHVKRGPCAANMHDVADALAGQRADMLAVRPPGWVGVMPRMPEARRAILDYGTCLYPGRLARAVAR